MKLRTFLITGLVAALLMAGVASYYASSHPDGLEFVAGETGFLDSAAKHHADDSPLADYHAKGVDDPRLSGGLAGVLGALTVLLIGGGLFWTIRRRDRDDSSDPHQHVDSH
ncbi:PDGLE domain-containing protein [Nocardioides sp. LHG3406-4]|uniref:PDGLE domain-containing protein n=1 Tax=Nocardioides sp. LHG3406-4 TaxID=2804575 RepID=UPI003CEBB8A1